MEILFPANSYEPGLDISHYATASQADGFGQSFFFIIYDLDWKMGTFGNQANEFSLICRDLKVEFGSIHIFVE